MWVCPRCNRQFKNTNQWHGCRRLKLSDLLDKRSEHIKDLYGFLHHQLEFKSYRREVVPPDVIFYKNQSTFLAVKLKTRWIDIEFFLDYYLDHPLIKKSVQTSKRRYAFVISIDEESDVTKELLGWIYYSYGMIGG